MRNLNFNALLALALYGLIMLVPTDFKIYGEYISLFVPTAGLAIAIAARFGPLWLIPTLSLYWIHLYRVSNEPLGMTVVALGLGLQAWVGLYLYQTVLKGDLRLRRREDTYKFILMSLAAPIVGSSVGALMYCYLGMVSWDIAHTAWVAWWYGESVGILFAGSIFLGGMQALTDSIRSRKIEAAGVMFATIAISIAVFHVSPEMARGYRAPLTLLPLPFLYWSATRIGIQFTALLLTLFGIIMVWGTRLGLGPFGDASTVAGIITLWAYTQLTGISALIMGALLSERDDAVDSLRSSEAKFRNLVESGPSVVYAFPHDDLLKITYISPQSETLLGYTPDECYARHGIIANMIHPDDMNRVVAEVQVKWLEKKTMLLEYRLVHRSGEIRWVRDEATYIHPRGATPAFWQGVLVDVTVHRASQELHRKTQELLAAIWKSSNGAIFVLDTQGAMLMANPAADVMMGLVVDEVTGKSYNDPSFRCETEHGEPLPDAAHPFRLVMDTQAPIQNYIHAIADGRGARRILSVDGSPLKDADGNLAGAFFIAEDITLAREAEEQRRSLEEQLRHAQRLEAVGQLAGGVAHDFNNLLQVMQGFTRLAMETNQPEAERQSHLSNVCEAAEKAAALTSQLLAFGRRQALEKTDCDLAILVEKHLNLVHRVIGEHITIEFTPEVPIENIRVDRSQLEQVLLNLCLNARDAMPGGGRLSIGLKNTLLDHAFCEAHPGVCVGPYALLTVSDTGCGMNPDVQSHAFEPFFTTKPQGHGTGLGLSVVHGIIQQHGGLITLLSEPGEGSTFQIYLPTSPKVATAPPPSAPAAAPSGTGTILLAEDEPAVREIAMRLLERAGYKVVTAADGAEALEKFRAHAGEISLLMLDVVMPRMGGFQAHQHIRELRPNIHTIFCSGYSGTALDTAGEIPAGTHFLQKPYNYEQLVQKIYETIHNDEVI